jgi:hypothetical protein
MRSSGGFRSHARRRAASSSTRRHSASACLVRAAARARAAVQAAGGAQTSRIARTSAPAGLRVSPEAVTRCRWHSTRRRIVSGGR